ncbi:uncharacterized protein LOC118480205 [Helianthus annuus]|uniref:uncharacterized protein LOC118480205 n=1 Tax=Helianthus annuus TaxID=4232 RepID=UPI001653398C|nr:uncharacterized protein LOC118480205 [Helianthus annuus]
MAEIVPVEDVEVTLGDAEVKVDAEVNTESKAEEKKVDQTTDAEEEKQKFDHEREAEEKDAKYKRIEAQLAIETDMENRDLSKEEEWTLAENRKVIREVENRKVLDLKQRARSKWATDGDENSKYFHALINNRKASNSIHGLNVNDQWCTKPSRIKKEIFSFFRDKFKEEFPERRDVFCDNLKKIYDSKRDMLVDPFTGREIKEAVFECGDDGAPGSDG